jgi:hypothetical protein
LPDRCLNLQGAGPPITPTIYNNFVRSQQGEGYVVILHEMGHEARVVPLDGRPHAPGEFRFWNGDSLGHREGDTLVVVTTKFKDVSAFPGAEREGPAYQATEKSGSQNALSGSMTTRCCTNLQWTIRGCGAGRGRQRSPLERPLAPYWNMLVKKEMKQTWLRSFPVRARKRKMLMPKGG